VPSVEPPAPEPQRPTLPAAELTTSALISQKGEEVRARIHARFAPNGPVDPTVNGLILRFADRSGTLVLETWFPASTFRARSSGKRFRLAGPGPINGLRGFSLWVGSSRARVSILAQGREFAPAAGHPDLTLTLRFGTGQCAVDADLVCDGAHCR